MQEASLTQPDSPHAPAALPREDGDIQTAVINLVDHLARIVPIADQPAVAHHIATMLAASPSAMAASMALRQSIIRRGTATTSHVAEALAAWVVVLFDLANLQHDRDRAMGLDAHLNDAAAARLHRALAQSRSGCILTVPHVGCLELFMAHLVDRGFQVGFVYSVSRAPTPTERWIYAGRAATRATPIAFARKTTGAAIAQMLRSNGVVCMAVDVYPSDRFSGIAVEAYGAAFRFPPGPARFARAGTPILPGHATSRGTAGFTMDIHDPIPYRAERPATDPARCFTQRLASHMIAFTADRPGAYWLWHPIPNDPYIAVAHRLRPDLLARGSAEPGADEAMAAAIDALRARWAAGPAV